MNRALLCLSLAYVAQARLIAVGFRVRSRPQREVLRLRERDLGLICCMLCRIMTPGMQAWRCSLYSTHLWKVLRTTCTHSILSSLSQPGGCSTCCSCPAALAHSALCLLLLQAYNPPGSCLPPCWVQPLCLRHMVVFSFAGIKASRNKGYDTAQG